MHLYTYLYLLVPLVTFHLILGTGTLDDGGALTERRSADATALKAEPVLLQNPLPAAPTTMARTG
uniref:G027_VD_Conantokin_precursor_conopeptide n=1 Tax=Conus geographus TaxID=6491 RepID=X5IXY2_CONGE|nr:G027_VD_Conantokin_precursor_conopeptide [Conus geographus]